MSFNIETGRQSSRRSATQMPTGSNPLRRNHLGAQANAITSSYKGSVGSRLRGNDSYGSVTQFAGDKMATVMQHMAQTMDMKVNQPILESMDDTGALFRAEQNALALDSKMTSLAMQTEFQAIMNVLS